MAFSWSKINPDIFCGCSNLLLIVWIYLCEVSAWKAYSVILFAAVEMRIFCLLGKGLFALSANLKIRVLLRDEVNLGRIQSKSINLHCCFSTASTVCSRLVQWGVYDGRVICGDPIGYICALRIY